MLIKFSSNPGGFLSLLGSSEIISIPIAMRNDYAFDNFSRLSCLLINKKLVRIKFIYEGGYWGK